MTKTVLVLAALAAMSGTALANDYSGKLQYPNGSRPAVEKNDLDHAATGSISRHGKLLPLKLKGSAAADPARPSGIEVNPFFPNPH